MKTYRGIQAEFLSILNLSARWTWVVNITPRPLYPAKEPRTYWIGRRMSPQGRPGHFGKQENILSVKWQDYEYYSIVITLKFGDFPAMHLTFYDQNIVHDGIRLELFKTQKLPFQVMFCQYMYKYFRCNLVPVFKTIYINTTLNDTYGIKTHIPIAYRVGSTAFYLMFYVTLEPHRPSLIIINVTNVTCHNEKYTRYIRFPGIFVPHAGW
jgi:hypothetical protein